MGEMPKGLIMYNPDGYMSAQIMNPDRKNFKKEHWTGATAEEYRQEGSTYLAYSGPFTADQNEQTLSHVMYISLFRIGQVKHKIGSYVLKMNICF